MEKHIPKAKWLEILRYRQTSRCILGEPELASELLEQILWPDGPRCPNCMDGGNCHWRTNDHR